MDLFTLPTRAGVVLQCHAIGVLRIEQDSRDGRGWVRNDRLLVVPTVAPRFDSSCRRWRSRKSRSYCAAGDRPRKPSASSMRTGSAAASLMFRRRRLQRLLPRLLAAESGIAADQMRRMSSA
jgi:hypothetical protein